MPRSKKIFLIFIGLFIIVIGWLVYDISTRTTFPGSKKHSERPQDTVQTDSIRAIRR